MNCERVRLGETLSWRRETVVIDDLATYRRCRIQQWGQGAVLRDQVDGASIKTKVQQRCHADQLVVAEIDAKVGGFAVVPAELEGAIVSSHYFLYDIDTAVLEPTFLAWCLRSKAFQAQVVARGTTNYAAIRPSDVLEYLVPLPAVDIQRHLADELNAAEQLIGKAQSRATATRASLAALSISAVRDARDRNVWPSALIADIADVLDSQRVPVNANERSGRQGPIPYYGAGGQVGWIDRALFDEPIVLLAEDAGPFDSTCGYLVDGPAWVNNHAHVLRGRLVTNEWLLWMFRTTDLRPFLSGSTRPKLTLGALRRISVPVAPVETQHTLTAEWRELGAAMDAALERAATSLTGLGRLMPRLVESVLA